jgi:predicted alpha/beta hydrolase family esterase
MGIHRYLVPNQGLTLPTSRTLEKWSAQLTVQVQHRRAKAMYIVDVGRGMPTVIAFAFSFSLARLVKLAPAQRVKQSQAVSLCRSRK